jgi:dihydrofolate reductase
MNDLSISLIAAAAENRVIGSANKMPWHLPEDLKRFKSLTWGNIVVMGRKTLESIGNPLPGRINIVLSSQELNSEVLTVSGMHEFFRLAEEKKASGEWLHKEVFIIGGEMIFRLFLPYAQRIYLTQIRETFPGDTFFPELDEREWQLISSEQPEDIVFTGYDYNFLIYEKRDRE